MPPLPSHCFLLNTAFVSHKFGYVVWSFSLNFRKSLISSFISSLTHQWHKWALFNFCMFVDFLKLVLLLNSNFKPWWSNKIHGIIPIFFVSVEVYFVTVYVFNFWEGSMRCWEEGIFFYVWMEYSIDVSLFYRCLLSPFELSYLLVLVFLCSFFLPDRPVQCWDWSVEVSHY